MADQQPPPTLPGPTRAPVDRRRPEQADVHRPGGSARELALVGAPLLAILLAAFNLRAGISSIGPVLVEVRADTGLSSALAGLITSIPLLCFAAVGVSAPALARRFGAETVIGWSAGLLGLALLARVIGGTATLLIGTLLACAGIALVNVLLPVVVKTRFPTRIGLVTGVYTAALAAGSATAAAVSAPLANAFGWRTALGAWGVIALVGGALWVLVMRSRSGSPARAVEGPDGLVAPPRAGGAPLSHLVRQPMVWALAVFFGTQAVLAYVQMGWLPTIFSDAGFSAGESGLLLSVSILAGVPVSFLAPSLAARRADQRPWTVGLTLISIAGVTGLLIAPTQGAWLWAVLLGIGSGTFALVLSLFGLKTRSPSSTAAVSAFGQSVGYLIAAVGPFGFGLLHDAEGGWSLPLTGVLAVLVVQVAAGAVAGRPVIIPDPPDATTTSA
ncbi:MAG: MFS transporter [Humibacillus sp.]|nr:MFS transporter [Humibacillus sp.]MDN5779369.1 MFS transporter [Humibacillus sp.]